MKKLFLVILFFFCSYVNASYEFPYKVYNSTYGVSATSWDDMISKIAWHMSFNYSKPSYYITDFDSATGYRYIKSSDNQVSFPMQIRCNYSNMPGTPTNSPAGTNTWRSDGLACISPNTTPTCSSGQYYSSAIGGCSAPPTCTNGQVFDPALGACKNPCPAAGTVSNDPAKYIFPADAASVCQNGCSMKVAPEICNLAECLGWMWQYEGTSCVPGTGSSSVKEPIKPQQSNDPKNPTSPADCLEAGLSFGYVGDKIVCHQPASNDPVTKTEKQKKTKTDASGVATTEEITKKTTDYGDKIKVEVSTSGGGGGGGSGSGSGSGSGTGTGDGSGDGSGSTETTEGDKSAYCEDNPNAEICKQEEEDPIDCEEGSLVEKLICESTKWEKGGDPGKFDLEPVYAEILEAKDNYTNEFNTIRASFSNLFNISLPHGTGSTAFTGHFRTNEIKVDMNEYPDLFSYLPTIVMIAAGIACIFIIFL